MLKSLLGNPVFQFILGRLIGGYMLFVGVTTRWRRVNEAAVQPFQRPNGGKLIGCIWHGRFSLIHKMWKFGRGVPRAKMLISQSREGGIVAHTSMTVGAEVIRGSEAKKGANKRKGGVEAMRDMARHIDGGGVMAMTPDGPRGPRMRVKRGPIILAKIAGAPLLAVTWATSNRIVFEKSWDQFVLPLPFGKGALIWGNPIAPPSPDASDAEVEAVRAALEAEMNRIAAEADRIAGVPAIEPAPPRADAAMAAAETAAQAT
ncbi:MAG: lysophospholipid acyltransferase family protein [Hyphomonadaceae bacterium]|nr:lysophospholipid acyltransferase family protein [Hyphomonadaceae bacterium]